MQETAQEVAELMKVLAHPKRLLTLCLLVEGEQSVGELARLLDMREQAMSQQLALLRKDGLVTTRREGQTIYYALARGDLALLLDFLYRTYCDPDGHAAGSAGGRRP
jgi:DNA-binding transcriptional ArsR family regulator